MSSKAAEILKFLEEHDIKPHSIIVHYNFTEEGEYPDDIEKMRHLAAIRFGAQVGYREITFPLKG